MERAVERFSPVLPMRMTASASNLYHPGQPAIKRAQHMPAARAAMSTSRLRTLNLRLLISR
jgi:hypothetical protein